MKTEKEVHIVGHLKDVSERLKDLEESNKSDIMEIRRLRYELDEAINSIEVKDGISK